MRALVLAAASLLSAFAQERGTPLFFPSRHRKTPLFCEVFHPGGTGREADAYPLMFLLHGGGGKAADFRALDAAAQAREHRVILVVVEGEASGFLDAHAPLGERMGEALLELVRELAKRYPGARARTHRAILGVSLGGFAALHHGLASPEAFGFVASLSGAVEWPQWGPVEVGALPPPIQALFRQAFGPPEEAGRLRHDLFPRVEALSAAARRDLPYLYLACGTEDPFYTAHRRWTDHLQGLGIAFEARERPGRHDGAYWKVELDEALRAYGRWRLR